MGWPLPKYSNRVPFFLSYFEVKRSVSALYIFSCSHSHHQLCNFSLFFRFLPVSTFSGTNKLETCNENQHTHEHALQTTQIFQVSFQSLLVTYLKILVKANDTSWGERQRQKVWQREPEPKLGKDQNPHHRRHVSMSCPRLQWNGYVMAPCKELQKSVNYSFLGTPGYLSNESQTVAVKGLHRTSQATMLPVSSSGTHLSPLLWAQLTQ